MSTVADFLKKQYEVLYSSISGIQNAVPEIVSLSIFDVVASIAMKYIPRMGGTFGMVVRQVSNSAVFSVNNAIIRHHQ